MPSGTLSAVFLSIAMTVASFALGAPAHAAPAAPIVTSAEYPDAFNWHDGVANYGTFTITSASPDVVRYRYWSFEAGGTLVPSEPGAAVSFRHAPRTAGPKFFEVRAYDAAGAVSPVTRYEYVVADGRPEAGAWNMADPIGSTQAADAALAHPASAGPGVVFGVPGPKDTTAVRLDGTPDAYLVAGPGVLSRPAFTVSAWVRPASLTADMTAVRLAGGFSLGYSAGDLAWEFALDGGPALHGGVAHIDEWAQLTAVHDAEVGVADFYVNGLRVATAPWTSGGVLGGAVEFGRGWVGDLASVGLHDRFIVDREIEALAELKPTRVRYWQLNGMADSLSPEHTGGPSLVLGGGPTIYSPQDDIFDPPALVGSGHLRLDGVDDHATTTMPVRTDRGFTISLAARPADLNRSMTVLSVAGENNSALRIRYNAQTYRWEAVVARSDAPGAETVVLASTALPSGNGDFLVFGYDRRNDLMSLYVTAEYPHPPVLVPFHADWSATGGLQLGRALVDGEWGEYFAGDVDELRLYEGFVDEDMARFLMSRTEQPDL